MPYHWVRIEGSGSSDDPEDRVKQVREIARDYGAKLGFNELFYPAGEERGNPYVLVEEVAQNDEMLQKLKATEQHRVLNSGEEKARRPKP